MARVDEIDVCEQFFIASVRGNMSMGFRINFCKLSVRGNISTLNCCKNINKYPFVHNFKETSENCLPKIGFL